jgi:hypothetical protein
VDFLQKHTQLVVSQPRLLQQVLLAKMQYLQVRLDYCHGRSTEDAGDVDQSSSAGASSCAPAATASSATAASAVLSCAPEAITSSTAAATGSVLPCGAGGLALQLRQELLDSGGWTTTSSWLPHYVPHAFVALFDGLRWQHLLHTRKTTRQEKGTRTTGYLTTLVKTTYLLRRGL